MSPDGKMPDPDSAKESIKVSIGPLNPDRWQEYRDLRLQALEEEPIAFEDPVDGKKRLLAREERKWRAMLEGNVNNKTGLGRTVLCAEISGKLVGTVDAQVGKITKGITKGIKATIQNEFVARAVREQGLGKKLLLAILAELEKVKDLHEVELCVFHCVNNCKS